MPNHRYSIHYGQIKCETISVKWHFQVKVTPSDYKNALSTESCQHFDMTFCNIVLCLFIHSGGMSEECDASYEDCALRETEEEIGIDRDRIDVWGDASLLHMIHLRNSIAIMPVIGSIHNYNENLLKINCDEVERVFTVPIIDLCRMKRHTQYRNASAKSGAAPYSFSMPVYTVDEARIWGITSIITHLFLQSLLPVQLYDKKIPYISKYKYNALSL